LYYHTSSQIEIEERGYFLRDNGPSKIPCQFASKSGQNVSQFTFLLGNERKSIKQYYAEKYGIKLEDDDIAVFVQDRGSVEKWPVPASRLYPIFKTDHGEVSDCSVAPFLSPADRIQLINGFLDELTEIRFSRSLLT